MAVLNNNEVNAASLLDKIVALVDSKSPANISYVKARMEIEAAGLARSPKRELKMAVISHLKGEIRRPDPVANPKHMTNQVVFPDGTAARF